MSPLTPADLYSLEQYAKLRKGFRAKVMAHKRDRRVHLGPHATLYFEDRLTIQYQIQEMLRIERIFEEEGIQAELDAYNPLIPDGQNLKATFMVEFANVEERKLALARLIGIEDRLWVQVVAFPPVYGIADEDLDREDETKTSSVHFIRFEFTDAMAFALKEGGAMALGSDHENYCYRTDLSRSIRDALARDLA